MPEDIPPPPPRVTDDPSRIALIKLKVVIACCVTLLLFFIYYALATTQPPRTDQQVILYVLIALFSAALLCGILDSSGTLQGTLKGMALSLGGAAAISFGLLLLLSEVVHPRLQGALPQAVVYSVVADEGQSFKSFEAELSQEEVLRHGSHVFKHERTPGGQQSITVIFGETAAEAALTVRTFGGTRTFKLSREDEKTRTTRLMMPSGQKVPR